MTYKTLKLDIDEHIYPQLLAFLRLLPAEQCVIWEEETKITAHQQLAALAGTWEGEELQRAPQEPIASRLKLD
jgi:hypothetical protein